MINLGLLLIFCMTRIFILSKNLTKYIFDNRVAVKRTYDIMGVQFEFIDMVKFLYNKHPMELGLGGTVLIIAMFTMLCHQYEQFNQAMNTFMDTLWYVLITVLTIGYGEYSAISFMGMISMVIATFFGIVLNSIFVVCTEKFL